MSTASLGAALASCAGLLVHVALLALAPFASGLEAVGAALASGRRPASPLLPLIRLLRARVLASSGPRPTPLLAASAGFALASTALASLLVPGFALGLPLAGSDGLVLVLFLLVSARLARVVVASCAAAADAVDDVARALPALVLLPVAGILVAALGSMIAASTRLDPLLTAVPVASGAARGLLLASLALLAVFDREECQDRAQAASRSWPAAALEAERMLRFAVFLTLVAIALPPATAVAPSAGVLKLVLSGPVFVAKVAVLAILVGLSRPIRLGVRPAALLGAAAFFGALGSVLVAVGQTLE